MSFLGPIGPENSVFGSTIPFTCWIFLLFLVNFKNFPAADSTSWCRKWFLALRIKFCCILKGLTFGQKTIVASPADGK